MDNVQELFALPIGLKPVTKIYDIQLYTSDTIKERYNDAISKSRVTSGISKEIKELVEKGKVVPCFASSGMVSFIKNKMISSAKDVVTKIEDRLPTSLFSNYFNSTALGFYVKEDKKLYVIIDNATSFTSSGKSDNDIVSTVTGHELIHMASSESPSSFLSIYKDELTTFYGHLFKLIFDLREIPNKEVQSIFSYLYNECERGEKFSLLMLIKKLQNLEKYSVLDHNNFLMEVIKYGRAIKLFSIDPNIYKRKIESDFLNIYGSIIAAYKFTFGKYVPGIVYCQELVFPSEVISVSTEIRIDSKTSKLVRSIL